MALEDGDERRERYSSAVYIIFDIWSCSRPLAGTLRAFPSFESELILICDEADLFNTILPYLFVLCCGLNLQFTVKSVPAASSYFI